MSSFANRVRVLTGTTGQGTVTLGAAFNNAFMTPVEAGAVDGETYRFVIEEGNDFEIVSGVLGGTGTTLTRVTVHKSKIAGVVGTTKMTLAGSATVRLVASAEDLAPLSPQTYSAGVLGMAASVALTIATAVAFAVGANGATNPTFQVDTSVGSVATGVKVTGRAVAAGTDISVISSGTNEALTINSKGSGTVTINGTGTGDITLARNTAITGTGTITSSGASALAVGRLGAVTPAFLVDASTASSITGLKVKSAATLGGVDLVAIGEANVSLRIDAAGTSTITIGGTSTGNITIGRSQAGTVTIPYTTASISTVTGSLVLSGTGAGLGVAGAGYFGGLLSAPKLVFAGSPTSTDALDFSGLTRIAVSNGGSAAITGANSGIYILVITEQNSGFTATYRLRLGGVTLVEGDSAWVASTATPAGGKISVAHNGTAYAAYNNLGSATECTVALKRMG